MRLYDLAGVGPQETLQVQVNVVWSLKDPRATLMNIKKLSFITATVIAPTLIGLAYQWWNGAASIGVALVSAFINKA